jgi:apolipoprotein D and lipocalin family protein
MYFVKLQALRSKSRFLQIALLLIGTAACITPQAKPALGNDLPPVETVPWVDLERYMGRWYEIASYPQFFQRNCFATTATYTLREDGSVDVLNACRKRSLEGRLSTAKGRATVADATTNAKLIVRFNIFASGDYWIIDLGRDYEFAVVGHPTRNYLWILSRSPQMDQATYEGILERLRLNAWDLSRLQKTVQPAP